MSVRLELLPQPKARIVPPAGPPVLLEGEPERRLAARLAWENYRRASSTAMSYSVLATSLGYEAGAASIKPSAARLRAALRRAGVADAAIGGKPEPTIGLASVLSIDILVALDLASRGDLQAAIVELGGERARERVRRFLPKDRDSWARPLLAELESIVERATRLTETRNQLAHLTLTAGIASVAEASWRDLGVQPASRYDVEGWSPKARRPVDDRVQAALMRAARAGVAVVALAGPSTAGKSRAMYDGIRELFGAFALVAPRDAASAAALLDPGLLRAALPEGPTPVVVWLDDLERFVRTGLGEAGLQADQIRDLRVLGRPVVVAATFGGRGTLLVPESARTDIHSPLQQLLERTDAEVLWLDPRELPEEIDAYPDSALAGMREETLGAFLVGSEKLIAKVNTGRHDLGEAPNRPGQKLVETLVDLRRCGVQPAEIGVVRGHWDRYVAPQQPTDELWSGGLEWASRPVAADLSLVSIDRLQTAQGDERCDLYLHDYVARRLSEESSQPVPDTTWQAVLEQAGSGVLNAFSIGYELHTDLEARSDQGVARRALEAYELCESGPAYFNSALIYKGLGERGRYMESLHLGDRVGDGRCARWLARELKTEDPAAAKAAQLRAAERGDPFSLASAIVAGEFTDDEVLRRVIAAVEALPDEWYALARALGTRVRVDSPDSTRALVLMAYERAIAEEEQGVFDGWHDVRCALSDIRVNVPGRHRAASALASTGRFADAMRALELTLDASRRSVLMYLEYAPFASSGERPQLRSVLARARYLGAGDGEMALALAVCELLLGIDPKRTIEALSALAPASYYEPSFMGEDWGLDEWEEWWLGDDRWIFYFLNYDYAYFTGTDTPFDPEETLAEAWITVARACGGAPDAVHELLSRGAASVNVAGLPLAPHWPSAGEASSAAQLAVVSRGLALAGRIVDARMLASWVCDRNETEDAAFAAAVHAMLQPPSARPWAELEVLLRYPKFGVGALNLAEPVNGLCW